MELPIKFHEKAKAAPSANGAGYPYRISATDLDRNFAYAALDVDQSWIEETTISGHRGRKLRLPALRTGGTFVLGCVNGNLEWIETEEC